MANDWILDVIADLKTFADKNGLGALAYELENASSVAASELAAIDLRAPGGALNDQGHARTLYRTYASGENA
jgi:hypothetical protein